VPENGQAKSARLKKPFPFQEVGAEWLTKSRFRLLADDMGLGKSVQAITAIHALSARNVLVICPAVVRSNWINEFRMWGDGSLTSQVIYKKQRGLPEVNVVVVSYDFAASHTELLKSRFWDVLVLDECHFLKSLDAKRARAVFGKDGICRHANYIWALSGTPAPNYIHDMWILLFSFGATKLGYDDFVKEFCTYYHFDKGYTRRLVVTGHRPEKIEEMKAMIDPIMLRRKMEEVMSEMPAISFHDLVVEAGAVDIAGDDVLFHYMRENRMQDLEVKLELEKRLLDGMLAGNGADTAVIEALKLGAKSIATLRRYSGLQKVDPIIELVSQELEAKAYGKIIIFAVHRNVVELLRQGLSIYGAVTVYGGTDPKKVQKRVDAFQNDQRTRVFIGNIQSAGTGITLTAANEVLLAETGYVPADIAQAVKRAHRIGQDKPVRVRTVSLAGSLDMRVNEIVRRKAAEMAEILG
jgi:SWI/SNF-related matrix-associated actin-dependent regulator 1 of chromatin subfamily A